MKTKLLRKVRKRYKIYRYPNGLIWSWFQTNVLTLVLMKGDRLLLYTQRHSVGGSGGFYVNGVLVSEAKAIKQLKKDMLADILIEYKHKGVRRIKHQQKKDLIYYNENTNNI